jgi:biotin synthase
MCFLAGANSIFTGDKLLTAPNSGDDNDLAMFARLGLKPMAIELTAAQVEAQRMPRGCAKLEAAE